MARMTPEEFEKRRALLGPYERAEVAEAEAASLRQQLAEATAALQLARNALTFIDGDKTAALQAIDKALSPAAGEKGDG